MFTSRYETLDGVFVTLHPMESARRPVAAGALDRAKALASALAFGACWLMTSRALGIPERRGDCAWQTDTHPFLWVGAGKLVVVLGVIRRGLVNNKTINQPAGTQCWVRTNSKQAMSCKCSG